MPTDHPDSYELDPSVVQLTRASLAIFLGLLMVSVALPYIVRPGEDFSRAGYWLTSLFGIAVFGTSSVLARRMLKKFPYVNLAADSDGIWYAHLGKEKALVSWSSIVRAKERLLFQCVDLLDGDGEQLIRIENNLNGFDALRAIIGEHIVENLGIPELPITLRKGRSYYLLHLVGVAGSAVLGLWLGTSNDPVLGLLVGGALVFLLVRGYVTRVSGLSIDATGIRIHFPFFDRTLHYSQIRSIELESINESGYRSPLVLIQLRDREKPFMLKRLGVAALELAAVLEAVFRSHESAVDS